MSGLAESPMFAVAIASNNAHTARRHGASRTIPSIATRHQTTEAAADTKSMWTTCEETKPPSPNVAPPSAADSVRHPLRRSST